MCVVTEPNSPGTMTYFSYLMIGTGPTAFMSNRSVKGKDQSGWSSLEETPIYLWDVSQKGT